VRERVVVSGHSGLGGRIRRRRHEQAHLRFELAPGVGVAALRTAGAQIGERADLGALPAAAPIAEAYEGAPAVAVELPGMPSAALRITLSGDELIMQVGPFRRHILLPESLRGASIRASREGDWVIVRRR
jgi:hypothetical protein